MQTKDDTALKGFNSSHITDELFSAILHDHKPNAKFDHFRPMKLNTSNSIIGNLTAADEEIQRFVGNKAYRVKYQMPGDVEDETYYKDVVLKAKPPGEETITMLSHLAKHIGGTLARVFEKHKLDIGFCNTDHREIEMLRIKEPAVASIQPRIFHTLKDEEKEIFVYLMENFIKEGFTHMDTVDDISVWKEKDILAVLQGVAGMHARYYGRTSEIPAEAFKWLKPVNMLAIKPLLSQLFQHNTQSFEDIWSARASHLVQKAIANLSTISDILESSPKTLVHNDCNVRNMCLRPNPREGKKQLCLYDWELASIAPPQHDVAEFLCFVLPREAEHETWQKYVHKYLKYFREQVYELTDDIPQHIEFSLAPEEFMRVFDISVLELLINRFSLIGMAHTQSPYPFLGRVIQNATGYVDSVKSNYSFLQEIK